MRPHMLALIALCMSCAAGCSSTPGSSAPPTPPASPTSELSPSTVSTPDSEIRAFPGAEGFGTGTRGGRGGQVCEVTSLADSGTGSLRACIEASGPRHVIFRTGGTILLRNQLVIEDPYITIAGQTAPGGGITLRMDPDSGSDHGTMTIATHDVVIRYLRFRPGNGGNGDDSHDAVTIYGEGVHDIVVDHSSFSWAMDENVNTYDYSSDITVSYAIIAEGLRYAGHPGGEHSKGMLAGGAGAHNVSIHHNLFVSNVDRNPQISGLSVADVRNNVIYNYGDGSGDGVTLVSSSKGAAQVNWVGNFYKPGPDSPVDRSEFATYIGDTGETHQFYGEDNVRWSPEGDQPARVDEDAIGQVTSAFGAPHVSTESATAAYVDVLATAGASLVRDAIDTRLVDEVRTGGGSLKDEGGPWPALENGVPPNDSDGDGVPDAYESAHGMDPNTPDAAGDVNCNGYDDVEDWYNTLVGEVPGPQETSIPDCRPGR